MKKTIRILIFAFLMLFAASFMTSCEAVTEAFENIKLKIELGFMDSAEQGEKLLAVADEKISTATSYTAGANLSISSKLNDQDVKISSDLKLEVQGIGGEDYTYSQEVKTAITQADKTTTVTTASGFQSNYMYSYFFSGDERAMLRSEISIDDYLEYQRSTTEKYESDSPEAYGEIFSEKLDDGWAVYITGFSDALTESLGVYSELFNIVSDAVISDLKITVKISKKLLYENIKIEFIFQGDDNIKAEMLMSFSDIDQTEAVRINLNQYTEVCDLRVLNQISEAVMALKEAENGKFNITISNKLNSNTSNYLEENKISYKNLSGGLSYDILSTIQDTNYRINYRDGLLSTWVLQDEDGAELPYSEAPTTEEEQKRFIESLIDYAAFDPTTVYEIKKGDDGSSYTLSLYLYSALCAKFQIDEPKLLHGSVNLTFTFSGEKLVSYDTCINLKVGNQYVSNWISIETACEYIYE